MIHWCLAVDTGLLRPDVVIRLTVPMDVMEERYSQRQQLQSYEKLEFQKAVSECFDLLGPIYRNVLKVPWIDIDTTRDVSVVHSEIRSIVSNL